MSGNIRSVAARMQQLDSTATFVYCFAHCTNLCLQALARESQCVHNALELVMGLSQLIWHSPKRSSLFNTLWSQVSPGAPTLKLALCPTRWTVRTHAIGALLTNCGILLDALEIIQECQDEYAMKANGYFTSMQQFNSFFWTQTFVYFFSATEQLSFTLQGKDTTIQEGVQAAALVRTFYKTKELMMHMTNFIVKWWLKVKI